MHWIIEPHIDAGYETPAEAQIIALQQQHLAFELWHSRNLRDFANQILSRHVGRVSAASEDEYRRPLRVGQDLVQPFGILE